MRHSGAELTVQALRAHGVEVVSGLVGDHILPICDLLPQHGIRLVDVRHDTAGVHLADGLSRATGLPAVALTTGGPGFANSIPGLAVASVAGSPVVHISGRTELATESMGGMQELDQIALASSVTKNARLVRRPGGIPTALAEAFRVAMAGRPGPVHVTIPLDVQQASIDASEAPVQPPPMPAPPPAASAAVMHALATLQRAVRPVLIVGGAARYSVQPVALQQLIEVTGLPLFTVEQARGLISDRHPQCIGYPDPGLNEAGLLISRADVVFLLGKKQDFRIDFCRPPFVSAGAQVLQADADPFEIGRNRAVAVGLVGDLGAVVAQLVAGAENLAWPDWSSWLHELQEARRSYRRRLEELSRVDRGTPMHPLSIYRAAEEILPLDATLLFDVGDFGLWGRAYMRAEHPGRWYWPGPLGHLGIMLPMALGAKVARQESSVVCFAGDGAVGFYFMEMDTAVRHNIPIVVVVGNDAAWGIDRTYQLEFYGRLVGTELRPIRYDRLVAEIGGHGEHVDNPEDLPGALTRALASKRPALVNVSMRSIPSPSAIWKIQQVRGQARPQEQT